MAKTWGEPIKKIVEAIAPANVKDSNPPVQEKCRFPKVMEGWPSWNVRFKGESGYPPKMHFQTPPEVGDEIEVRCETDVKEDGKEWKNWFTTEQYKMIVGAPKGGGFGGGAKPNYTPEQEAMRDGQKAAIEAIKGGLIGKDGKMDMNLPNIRNVAAALAADILGAGKKSEPA